MISNSLDFNQLYHTYHPRFVLYANSYVRDIDVAKDLTTDAFVSFWERRNILPKDTNIPAFILITLKNKCLNHLRHTKVKMKALNLIQDNMIRELQLRIVTLEASNPEDLFSTDLKILIQKTLKTLPSKTYEIFVLSRVQNKPHKIIAEKLGISTKSVEFHITKALACLRKNLKDYLHIFLIIYSLYY